MAKIPSENVIRLIKSILLERNCTQAELAEELQVDASQVTRWLGGEGISGENYKKLVAAAPEQIVEPIRQPLKIPFSVTIPRDSITISTDTNGDIRISGVILAKIDGKEGS